MRRSSLVCGFWRFLRLCYVHMPTMRIMGGNTSYSTWVSSGWRMAYLSSFWFIASMGNQSLQYVNSKIYILRFGLSENKGLVVDVGFLVHTTPLV